MENEHDIVDNAALDEAYANANFGSMKKRDVIRLGVLKCASGFKQGHTSKTICEDLGLIGSRYTLTRKGKRYLWAAFGAHTGF